jgi:type IV secretory pathway VirB10-like protein
MKAITLSLLMLALTQTSFAQTPAGPVDPPAATQPAATVETTPAAHSAPIVTPESRGVADAKIEIPKDTTIPMILMNTINTRSAYVGQAIYCESIYPITVRNHIVIPKGSSIRGTVTEVLHPGRLKGRAQLGLRFDELILPNGTTRHLRAALATRGKEIVLPHGTSLELQLGQPVYFDREELEPPSNYDAGPNVPRQEYGSRN